VTFVGISAMKNFIVLFLNNTPEMIVPMY